MSVLSACVFLLRACPMLTEARTGFQILWNRELWATTWVLGIKSMYVLCKNSQCSLPLSRLSNPSETTFYRETLSINHQSGAKSRQPFHWEWHPLHKHFLSVCSAWYSTGEVKPVSCSQRAHTEKENDSKNTNIHASKHAQEQSQAWWLHTCNPSAGEVQGQIQIYRIGSQPIWDSVSTWQNRTTTKPTTPKKMCILENGKPEITDRYVYMAEVWAR